MGIAVVLVENIPSQQTKGLPKQPLVSIQIVQTWKSLA
jgi:hypothetical protein